MALRLDRLTVGYPGQLPVLSDLSLTVRRGEFICLIGRNGVGKSTLLRAVAGVRAPLGGAVLLDERPLLAMRPVERARRVAVVLTERPQAPGLTVRDVVELGRSPHTSWLDRLRDDDHRIVQEALTAVGADAWTDRLLDALSDGERQRVMIARGLAQRPDVLLLDEITAFLDLPSRVAVMCLLRDVARQQHCAVVLSSHDLDLILQLADRLWLLPGDGTLVDDAPEALALTGRISEAFGHAQVHFSSRSGGFELVRGGGLQVVVTGPDEARRWTARAVERLGLSVVEAPGIAGAPAIDVSRVDGRWVWRLSMAQTEVASAALSEIVAALRERTALPPGQSVD